jgi:hypothetical protein
MGVSPPTGVDGCRGCCKLAWYDAAAADDDGLIGSGKGGRGGDDM